MEGVAAAVVVIVVVVEKKELVSGGFLCSCWIGRCRCARWFAQGGVGLVVLRLLDSARLK